MFTDEYNKNELLIIQTDDILILSTITDKWHMTSIFMFHNPLDAWIFYESLYYLKKQLGNVLLCRETAKKMTRVNYLITWIYLLINWIGVMGAMISCIYVVKLSFYHDETIDWSAVPTFVEQICLLEWQFEFLSRIFHGAI